jgi:hypothetical protein
VQVDLINIIDRSTWAVMNNGIDPSGILSISGANEDQCTIIQNAIQKKHSGVDQKGKTLVIGTDMDSKGASYNSLIGTAKEMANGDAWDRYASFTLAVFGVTMGIIGLKKDNGSYSSNWAEIQNWQVRKLQPFCAMIADFLTHGPLRDWGGEKRGYRLQIDLPKISDPELLEQQISADQKGAAITVNQQLALRGRPPVEGGDEVAEVYLAMRMQKMAPPPVAPPILAGKPGNPAKPGFDSKPANDPAKRPENTAAASGSLPNRVAKSMNSLTGSDGGFVVEQRTAKRRVLKGAKAKKRLGCMVKAIIEGGK